MSKTKNLFIYTGATMMLIISLTGWILFFVTSRSCNGSETGLKLVIDHDGGADDALAITMSLLNEKYFNGPKVVALTVTFGNVNESQAVINSERILDLCNRSDIPIYSGAREPFIKGIKSDYYFGYDGLGDEGYMSKKPVAVENSHAAIGLIELSKKYEGNLIVMAIGALTNIALAISLDPNFIRRLSQLYVGAGHVYGEAHPSPEFNADMDPEAYHIVAQHARVDKVTLIPFSQSYKYLNITKDWRKKILGAINTPLMKALNGFERISLSFAGNVWNLLDPVVASIVLDSSVVTEYRNTSSGIILCGDMRGINTNDFNSPDPNARLVYSEDVKEYQKFLIDIYSAELQKPSDSTGDQ